MAETVTESKGFSRRSFLKGSAVAAALGATGIALTGCGQSNTASDIPSKWDNWETACCAPR
ncbi:MAG: twin-arginine translocation signal domain-containing protein [Gordonibacter sp.]|uniref:twin-arginine translocation signal domain-containing protein n=1 Tax=Gordonibacter sp. TaxID=1968902 RepID=UPI002FC6415E